MIDIYSGEIIDILPSWLAEKPEVIAISYAIKQAFTTMLAYRLGIYSYAMVDQAPEYILDLMAAEMRVKYYQDELDADIKRDLIKNAMQINTKDGTRWAVERLLEIIYGEGEITEWYDYNGTPNHFRIVINPKKSRDYSIIINLLDTVKRKTARLDGLVIANEMKNTAYVGIATMTQMTVNETMDGGDWLLDHSNDVLTDENGVILTD